MISIVATSATATAAKLTKGLLAAVGIFFAKAGLRAPYIVNIVMGANAEAVNVAIPIDDYLEIVEARESHVTAGSDAGGLTLTIEKLTGTQAPAGGANMFKTSTFDLKGVVANTNTRLQASAQTGLTAAQKAARNLSPGDRVGLTFTGTPTAVAGIGVTLVFKRNRRGATGSYAR